MSAEKYVPQAGDRVRMPGALEAAWVDVLHVGERLIFGRYPDGGEDTWELDRDWMKVEVPTPLPEIWFGLTPDGEYRLWTEVPIVAYAAVVHVWTDKDGTDQATIERFSW